MISTCVRIEVRDQGVGFDPEAARAREGLSGGFGLFSLRERLDALGGTLETRQRARGAARARSCASRRSPLSPGHGANHHEWLGAACDGLGQGRVGRLEGEVLFAGEEPEERPAAQT